MPRDYHPLHLKPHWIDSAQAYPLHVVSAGTLLQLEHPNASRLQTFACPQEHGRLERGHDIHIYHYVQQIDHREHVQCNLSRILCVIQRITSQQQLDLQLGHISARPPHILSCVGVGRYMLCLLYTSPSPRD